jgi:hypothetical protein
VGFYRRLSKDYEQFAHSSECMIYLASFHIVLKRLAASFSDRLSIIIIFAPFHQPLYHFTATGLNENRL